MASFRVVSDAEKRARDPIRVIKVITSAGSIADLVGHGKNYPTGGKGLEIYFYLLDSDVRKHAYHAKLTAAGAGGWIIEPGDVALRRAIWQEYH